MSIMSWNPAHEAIPVEVVAAGLAEAGEAGVGEAEEDAAAGVDAVAVAVASHWNNW